MQPYPLDNALAELANSADDVAHARRQTAQGAIERFVVHLDAAPLAQLMRDTLPEVDFDTWYAGVRGTIGSKVGSGRLSWPNDRPQRVALQVELLRRLAAGTVSLIEFAFDFHYVDNNYNLNVAEFAAQTFRPAYRDLAALLRANVPAMPESTTRQGGEASRPKRIINKLTAHPGIAAIVVVGIVVVALAQFTEALGSIADFAGRFRAPGDASTVTEDGHSPSAAPSETSPDTVWGDVTWTEWAQTVIAATVVSRAHLIGDVSVSIPDCAKMVRDSVQTAVDWGGGDGSGWGQWIAGPVYSPDGRSVSRAYDHWKHDRPRAIRIRVQYIPCAVR